MIDMSRKIHDYASDQIKVTYEPRRCIHAAACVRSLPEVFDPTERRWIRPERGSPEEIAAAVARCPTGALQFERLDGGPAEAPPDVHTIVATRNGPLLVHGRLRLNLGDDITRDETRVALCRCGHSQNKPYCDDSHVGAGFRAD